MGRKVINLMNKSFGYLTVIAQDVPSKQGAARWKVRCTCGTEKSVRASQLLEGNTVSCGCYRKKVTSDVNKTHGMTNSFEFKAWTAMIKRCTYNKHPAYHLYGGRGITIDPAWMAFEQFYKDMGACPFEKGSIDRLDNSKGYNAKNCRWLPRAEQAKYRRNVELINGKTIPDLAKELKIKYTTLKRRIKSGWPEEKYGQPVMRNN